MSLSDILMFREKKHMFHKLVVTNWGRQGARRRKRERGRVRGREAVTKRNSIFSQFKIFSSQLK
jgi:hypothetical protein